ncbi:LOW QUALITY PROTEIN: hypothetical protein IFM47457_01666 [Aspergillus lentulus]|nr:LOW QUALITY PROTEIN: hypothetical protein IFM47457_01666 [Aspergillus lentulus]
MTGHDVFYLLLTDAITNDLLGTLRTGRVRPLQSPAIALNTIQSDTAFAGTPFWSWCLCDLLARTKSDAFELTMSAIACAEGWFNRNRETRWRFSFSDPSITSHPRIGFGWAMRACGFLLLLLLITANLTVRAWQPPRPMRITGARSLNSNSSCLAVGFFLFTYAFCTPLNYLPSQALASGMNAKLA